MPYYEFECDTCGKIHEKFYRVIPRVTPLHTEIECDQCGGLTAKKVVSVSSFHLKGVGWAKDGYDGSYQDGSKVVDFNESP